MESSRKLEVSEYDYMNAATIYNPDNPYDMLEINPHGDHLHILLNHTYQMTKKTKY